MFEAFLAITYGLISNFISDLPSHKKGLSNKEIEIELQKLVNANSKKYRIAEEERDKFYTNLVYELNQIVKELSYLTKTENGIILAKDFEADGNPKEWDRILQEVIIDRGSELGLNIKKGDTLFRNEVRLSPKEILESLNDRIRNRRLK